MATALQSCIGMSQEIVAVVDDGIIVAHAIVLIGRLQVEAGQTLQVGRGLFSGLHKVGTCLAKQHDTIGNSLNLVDDAQSAVD